MTIDEDPTPQDFVKTLAITVIVLLLLFILYTNLDILQHLR